MIIFVFLIFFSILAFPWQRQPFWKNQPLKAQLHMAYDIPTKVHKVWSRHLREMCRRNFWQKKERKRIIIIKDEVLITVSCPIFPSILITKYLFTGNLKNRSIDNLETQKKYISMKNSQFFNYLLYAKSK